MILSDQDIMKQMELDKLVIEPFESDNVEPSSVDLRLGEEFKRVDTNHRFETVSLQNGDGLSWQTFRGSVLLRPGDFILATTKEHVELPDDIAAKVLGRSSLGRLGISVHQTAGYIDPGFEGQITLELSNHGPAPVTMTKGNRICQIVFEELSSPASKPYGHEGSNYQGQTGATPSSLDFE